MFCMRGLRIFRIIEIVQKLTQFFSEQKLNANGPTLYPVLQQQLITPKPPKLVIPPLSNVSGPLSLQKTQNLSSDDEDDVVELDPLDLGEDDGGRHFNDHNSTSGVLSNKVIADVSNSDPLALEEEEIVVSSIPSTSKPSGNHVATGVPKKTVPMFPCPFCPDRKLFSSSNLHEHIQKSHQQKQPVISVDPLEEFS
jgi:hypothetical protein